MTGKLKYLLPPLLFAVLVIAGCSGEDVSPSAPGNHRTRIADDVVVIDDDPGIRLYDISDRTLIFERLGDRTIRERALVVGSEMGGYIRRVRIVEEDGRFLRVKAEPRFLQDAVISGQDDRRFMIGPGSAASIETAAPASGAGISLDGLTIFGGAEEGDPFVSIERGYLSFSPAVDIGIGFFGHSVTRFGVSLEGELGIDLDIRAELPEEILHSGTIQVASFKQPAKMKIGDVPIPVVIELDIFIDSAIEGILTEPCDAGYAGSHTISSGIYYSGRWEETGGAPGLAFELPEMAIGPLSDCSIRITVRTELRVTFYSADTAVIGIAPWLEADSDVIQFPVWKWRLTGGLDITRRFAPGIIARQLQGFESLSLTGSIILDSGPYEAEDYIFVREWGGPGSDRNGFDQPRGIAIGQQGNLYVTDQNNHRVVIFDRLGEYTGEWGSYGSSAGMFIFPAGIAVASDGTVLVSDSGNHRVQRFTSDGEFLGQWGEEGTGDGEFVQLEGIAAGPDSLMAVCDSGTSSFSIYTLDGTFVGRFPSVLARGAAFDAASDIFTAGCRSDGVTRTDRSGQFIEALGPDLCVTDLAVDGTGKIYLLDYDLDRLDILDPAGDVISTIGASGAGPGEFDRPGGVAVSPEGWVYIADTANNRIQVFAPK